MADTKLARALAGKSSPTKAGKFAQAIAGARVYEPWSIPRLGIDCSITLVAHNRSQEIEGAVYARMAQLKLPLTPALESIYETHRAVLYAAEAIVDRETREPIGTADEWGLVDVDIIAEFWRAYGDVREAYDPVDMPLTDEELRWIVEGIKKKEPRLLRLCGSRRLSTFTLFLGDQLLSFLSPNSGATSSPPEILESSESPAPDAPTSS